MRGVVTSSIGLLPKVLGAQIFSFVLVLIVAWGLSALFGLTARPPALVLAFGQGTVAVVLSRILGLSCGWLLAQFALPLLAWAGLIFDVPSWVFLAAFAVLVLVYSNTSKDQVPLYLSNRTTWAALSELLKQESPLDVQKGRRQFADLGSGLGGTIAYLAKHHPEWDFIGVENAPVPYAVCKLRLLGLNNAHVRFENIWDTDLSRFDVVYAFLSPAPMPRLIECAMRTMKPSSLLISNSFWAPDQPFDGEAGVNDRRKTRLFFKRITKG